MYGDSRRGDYRMFVACVHCTPGGHIGRVEEHLKNRAIEITDNRTAYMHT